MCGMSAVLSGFSRTTENPKRCTTLPTRQIAVSSIPWLHGSKEYLLIHGKFSQAQGIISDMVSQIFGISHGYYGQVLSNIARLHMSDAVEESNEKHLAPWSRACSANGIQNTPLTPYIDKAG